MTRAISGHCSQISIKCVTFEIEAGIVKKQGKLNETLILLFDKNITDATFQIFGATDMQKM